MIKSALLIFALALGAQAGAMQLIHNPVLTAPAGQAIEISAMVSGVNSATQFRLYYRITGTEQYSSVPMGGDSYGVNGEIPAASVTTQGIDYYIIATLNGMPQASSPAVNPSISPNNVVVRVDESKPNLTILSPMDGDVVDSSTPVITVSWENGDLGIVPESVVVKVDGKKITDPKRVQSFDTLMSYVPSADLSQGQHTVEVAVKNTTGTFGSIKWTFSVDSMGGGKLASASVYHWDGYASYETLYGLVTDQPNSQGTPLPYRPYGANRLNVEVNGRGPTDTYQLKVYATDEDRSDEQATDRFTALMENEQGLIVLGDYSPTFSELSMYDPYNLRGITVDLRDGDLNDGHTRLMAVFGQTMRAVAQGAAAFGGGTASGTYAQYLAGVRWEGGDKYFVMGLNAVTVNDDEDSLPGDDAGTVQPQYSGVGSADAKIQIPQIGLKMTGEAGADYDFNGPSVVGVSAGSAYVANADWNYLPWGTHVSFDWKDLGGSFGYVPGGYATMANPGLIPDYRGYESSISQGLFSNQFSLAVNVNGWRNDLQNIVDETADYSNFVSVFTTIAPTGWPSLNVGYSLLLQNNNLNHVVLDADGTTISPLDTNTGNLSANLGYTHAFTPLVSLALNGGLQQMMLMDDANIRSVQDIENVTYQLSSLLTIGNSSFNVAGSFGYSDQQGFDESLYGFEQASGSGDNDTISVTWMQRWIPNVFNTHLGYDWVVTNSTLGSTDFVPSSIDNSTRSTYTVGGDYTINQTQLVTLVFGYSSEAVLDSPEDGQGTDMASMFMTDVSYKWTF